MSSPIWASQMLRTAAKLAGEGAGPGRPALCDLRRATSTAYYALFHQMTRHGALAAVPTSLEPEVADIARWFTHTGMREASALVLTAAGTKPPKKADVSAVGILRTATGRPFPVELRRVAQTFVELQEARHEADYSHDYDPVRYITIGHVATAREAVRTTWSMWRAGRSSRAGRQELHDSYNRFLQIALLKSGGPKTR